MKTVRVRAANLKAGDVINGQRIKAIHAYPYRVRQANCHKTAFCGILVVVPNPSGNKLDTFDFRGDKFVLVKRPKYNMKRRHKS